MIIAIIADKAMSFSGFDTQTSVIFCDFFLLVIFRVASLRHLLHLTRLTNCPLKFWGAASL